MSDEQKPEENVPADEDEVRDESEEQADSEALDDEDQPLDTDAEQADDKEPSNDDDEPSDDEDSDDEPSDSDESGDGEPSDDEGDDSAEAEDEKEEEAGPTPGSFDGLDSGLAWYGTDAFEPPLPAGYLPPPEPAEGAGPAPVGDRSQRIKDRLASRRAETDAEKKWYQKIPTPIWICMPATIFIIVWVVLFAKPWQQIPEPGSDKKFDTTLLQGKNVENWAERTRALNIRERVPALTWKILPGDILGMKSRKGSAKVVFEPAESKDFTVSCEVCIADTLSDFSVWMQLHTSRGVGLVGSDREAAPIGAGCLKTNDVGQTARWLQSTPIKPNYWYSLAIRVQGGVCTYYVNGKALPHTPAAPQDVKGITLTAVNALIYIRDWKVTPSAK